MSDTLEVWIDAANVGELTRVGRISHDRGHVRFQYDRAWLTHPRCFDIDPDLSLDQATFHPDPALGHFGIFLDSSPDRWGQTLMKRREALEARDQGRTDRSGSPNFHRVTTRWMSAAGKGWSMISPFAPESTCRRPRSCASTASTTPFASSVLIG